MAVAASETAPIIREERLTGTVTSPRSAALSSQVAGLVQRLLVDAGDRVEAGQLLLELDRELAAHTLARMQAQVERAEAALADARRRLREGRALVRDAHIPESELEDREAEVATAVAELAAVRAEARHQASLLQRHALRAPFGGVISRRDSEVGEWVEPGTRVFELVAMEGLRFDFQVAQELFPHVQRDTRVTLRLDALPRQRFPGCVTAIVPVSDVAARTFLLRVRPVQEHHPAVTPGMSVQALLTIDSERRGVVVPRDALLRHPDGRVSVWVLERAGDVSRVRERRVETGLAFRDRVEIRGGLAAGVPVVVEGNEALQDGQVVRVRGGE